MTVYQHLTIPMIYWTSVTDVYFTVVQAVLKANSQSNGNGQISTPNGPETPERISKKLGYITTSGV